MKKIFFLLTIASFLFACKTDSTSNNSSKNQNVTDLTPGNADRYYGGIFHVNEEAFFKTLYPHNITEVVGHRIINNVYEGLVGFNQADLSIEPCLAASYDISEDGKTYTFHLRKGVKFHDNDAFTDGKGREVTAHDFKYCFDRLCTPDGSNQGFWLFNGVVAGAEDHYNALADGKSIEGGVSGVRVVDDYTLEIELEEPTSVFLSRLAMAQTAVFPKEVYDKHGIEMRAIAVGTGPFIIKNVRENQAVYMEKNPDYWGEDEFGNQLPFLNAVNVTFINDKKSELLEFKLGNHDLMYRLPFEMIDQVVVNGELLPEYGDFQLQQKNVLSLQYYGFLHQGDLFDDINLRKAFNYAIDREKLCNFTLKGAGAPAVYGVVPPGMAGYDHEAIKGYNYDPEKAREYMTKAGYPNGQGFPGVTLQLNSGGGRNAQVAEAIQNMLNETLNINVELHTIPWAQHTENVEQAKADFWRLGWVADYPDPENFLNLFWGKWVPESLDTKTYINSFRYKNPNFDNDFVAGKQSVNAAERNAFYLKADQQVIDDAVVLPIYYDKDYRLLQPDVRNFPMNAMEQRSFHDVYFVPGGQKLLTSNE